MKDGHTERRMVKSDETLLSIVEYLREADGAGVTEIANHLKLAKSTVYDHLVTMREYGFFVKRGQRYHLGLQFFSYGQYVRNQFKIYEAAKPVVDRLTERTGEMVWLIAHENGRIMYLYGHAGATDINANSLIGSWAYMHCNSAGKAILAHLDDSEVEQIIQRHGLPARTEYTTTDPDELRDELTTIRQQGFALNMGEDLEGIHAIGVPLLFDEEVQGALAVAGPAHRVTRERCEEELAEQLFAARNDIELNLVYS
ncbi:IclR family transcriptional regulator [Haloferax namakaokahaiae]|uniref:IclR family transcriptional regulator n=1 Tax=Haloferax namakaokahaiae TaxID=1748331 RepID=A0ABD5ZDU8_9EURY